MDGKKNSLNEPVTDYRTPKVVRPIRLTPCSADYATSVELTARMLGMGEIDGSKRKPCKELLRLANLDC
jgi:hypothetical protein